MYSIVSTNQTIFCLSKKKKSDQSLSISIWNYILAIMTLIRSMMNANFYFIGPTIPGLFCYHEYSSICVVIESQFQVSQNLKIKANQVISFRRFNEITSYALSLIYLFMGETFKKKTSTLFSNQETSVDLSEKQVQKTNLSKLSSFCVSKRYSH